MKKEDIELRLAELMTAYQFNDENFFLGGVGVFTSGFSGRLTAFSEHEIEKPCVHVDFEDIKSFEVKDNKFIINYNDGRLDSLIIS